MNLNGCVLVPSDDHGMNELIAIKLYYYFTCFIVEDALLKPAGSDGEEFSGLLPVRMSGRFLESNIRPRNLQESHFAQHLPRE